MNIFVKTNLIIIFMIRKTNIIRIFHFKNDNFFLSVNCFDLNNLCLQ